MQLSAGSPVVELQQTDGAIIRCVPTEGEQPTVVFCGGLKSDMTGSKALAFEEACRNVGRSYIRFDYRGHGISDGIFQDFAIGEWLADARLVIEKLAGEKLVLVGSSMGMWVVCLLLKELHQRVAGCIGIAGAPDFTHQLMYPALTEEQCNQLMDNQVIYLASDYDDEGYPLTQRLFSEGHKYAVLDKPIPVSCPVRLFQGMDDEPVPWQHSIKLLNALDNANVKLTLIKGGDHSLSSPENLKLLSQAVLSAGEEI